MFLTSRLRWSENARVQYAENPSDESERLMIVKKQLNRALSIFCACTFVFAIAGMIPAGTAEAKAFKTPAKAKIQSVRSIRSGQVVVRIKKIKGASIYQYKLGTDKRVARGVKVSTVTATVHTFQGLKSSKRYYVKVRALGDKWGKWSKVKSVKTLRDSGDTARLEKELAAADGRIASLSQQLATARADLANANARIAELEKQVASGGNSGTGGSSATQDRPSTSGETYVGDGFTLSDFAVNVDKAAKKVSISAKWTNTSDGDADFGYKNRICVNVYQNGYLLNSGGDNSRFYWNESATMQPGYSQTVSYENIQLRDTVSSVRVIIYHQDGNGNLDKTILDRTILPS